MNRIKSRFRLLRKEKRCGFIAYVTCGDPDVETTIEIVAALERNGADIIELGVPFSDPIADGPVIQAASHRALLRGTTLEDVFQASVAIRRSSEIPLIAFTYLNPILRFGVEKFARRAAEAGIDGVLITDLPPESADEIRGTMAQRGLAMIFLATPTTSERRLRMIDRASDGFVYYVSTTGVTGSRVDLADGLLARLQSVRAILRHPLAVGFGISRHEHYEQLREVCDAVVVGSAIVKAGAAGSPNGAAERAGAIVSDILGRQRAP